LHPGREQALHIQIDSLVEKDIATSVSGCITVVFLDVALIDD
jgi:hypothetical protein